MSLPAWGVWIEIASISAFICSGVTSLPAWGVWIEIVFSVPDFLNTSSLPAWGVWIEIRDPSYGKRNRIVAPRMGSVD